MSERDLDEELRHVLNRYCAENDSNTPALILARFMLACKSAFDTSTLAREDWYGHRHAPGRDAADPPAARLLLEECHDIDVILFAIGMFENAGRTAGGRLNVPKIIAHIRSLLSPAPAHAEPDHIGDVNEMIDRQVAGDIRWAKDALALGPAATAPVRCSDDLACILSSGNCDAAGRCLTPAATGVDTLAPDLLWLCHYVQGALMVGADDPTRAANIIRKMLAQRRETAAALTAAERQAQSLREENERLQASVAQSATGIPVPAQNQSVIDAGRHALDGRDAELMRLHKLIDRERHKRFVARDKLVLSEGRSKQWQLKYKSVHRCAEKQTAAELRADKAEAERNALQAALAEAQANSSLTIIADARRYAWLRDPERPHSITIERWGIAERATLHGEYADRAIDAALDAAPGAP